MFIIQQLGVHLSWLALDSTAHWIRRERQRESSVNQTAPIACTHCMHACSLYPCHILLRRTSTTSPVLVWYTKRAGLAALVTAGTAGTGTVVLLTSRGVTVTGTTVVADRRIVGDV
jgi:hypothetical protein